MKGTVKFWNEDKGYGFIETEDGLADHFCHANMLEDPDHPPGTGAVVEFDSAKDQLGRLQAENVRVLEPGDDKPSPGEHRPHREPRGGDRRPSKPTPPRRERIWTAEERKVMADRAVDKLFEGDNVMGCAAILEAVLRDAE